MPTRVFPVHTYKKPDGSWGKAPAIPKGENWKTYDASENELKRAKNLGCVIPEGRVVIDLDTRKGVTRQAVESALGVSLPWDDALLQYTVSGGEHYAFALPDGAQVRQGSNLLNVTGFDTRTAGLGWICCGAGYRDATFVGVPVALNEWAWPTLPDQALSALAHGYTGAAASSDDDLSLRDLESAISAKPLDCVSLDDAKAYLAKLPAGDVSDHDCWVKVGMALHHQFAGSREAFDAWVNWSKGDAEKFDPDDCRTRWRSFGKRTQGPRLRFDYVIHRAGGRAAVANTDFDALVEQAEQVDNMEAYDRFKLRVCALGTDKLTKDRRAMVANALYQSFGRGAGLTKAEVKQALAPVKGLRVITSDGEPYFERHRPDWVNGWAFVESTCDFVKIENSYWLSREAFNAKFDREPECFNNPDPEARLIHASEFALNKARIETYADALFMPACELEFEMDGKRMLNSYAVDGVEPASVLEGEGLAAVQRFCRHFEILIEDPIESRMALDFMAHIYQKPEIKMTWALLVQGAEGTGKTYLARVMQALLGRNVKSLDPSVIGGRFTAWATGSVLAVVEEIIISGDMKYEMLDKLKQYVSNDTISIECKGRDPQTVPNTQNYIFFTNHGNALPIDENDRRYGVAFSRFQTKRELFDYFGGEEESNAYFDKLFEDLENHAPSIARYLADHEISESFKPRGRAPMTNSKRQLINNSATDSDQFFDEALANLECDVINDKLVDMTHLRDLMLANYDRAIIPSGRILSAKLRSMGFSPLAKRLVRVGSRSDNKRHTVWRSRSITDDQATHIVKSFHENNPEGGRGEGEGGGGLLDIDDCPF